MSAGAPPSSPGPRSSRVVAPSVLVAMPSPPPIPPAAAAAGERPLPPMKLKKLFPYAVYFVFGGMNRAWGVALIGLQIVLFIVRFVALPPDAEDASFWTPIFLAVAWLCVAFLVLMTCFMVIRYYMPVDGAYVVKLDLPPQQQQPAAAAAMQLPPPPPEMDLC